MTPAEILKAAKAKIADPANWCQGAFAKNAAGYGVNELHASACQWCAVGSVRSASYALLALESEYAAARDYLDGGAAFVSSGNWAAPGVNDVFGHERVMEMFDVAIKLAERET